MHEPGSAHGHALGHAQRELERLAIQACLIAPIQRHLFKAAGTAPGVRVPDVGSGFGHVAFLLAEMAGPAGSTMRGGSGRQRQWRAVPPADFDLAQA